MLVFKRPMIAAHRGFSAKYPENTMASFAAAVLSGARMIELDVALSRDGEVVVIHDATLNRTTDGTGAVDRLSLAELKRLSAGSWFHPRFAAEKIPTLEAVLRRFKKEVLINIEIKKEGGRVEAPSDLLERRVVQLVREQRARSRVVLSSFDTQALAGVVRLDPSLSVGWLVETPFDDRRLSFLDELKPFSFHPQLQLLNEAMVAACHGRNIAVFVWDVLTAADIERCLLLGADGVFVDDPVTATAFCRSKGLL